MRPTFGYIVAQVLLLSSPPLRPRGGCGLKSISKELARELGAVKARGYCAGGWVKEDWAVTDWRPARRHRVRTARDAEVDCWQHCF